MFRLLETWNHRWISPHIEGYIKTRKGGGRGRQLERIAIKEERRAEEVIRNKTKRKKEKRRTKFRREYKDG